MATQQNVANINNAKEASAEVTNIKELTASMSSQAPLWWFQPWLESVDSAVKFQQIWLSTMSDLMQHESEFLTTLMESSSKLAQCAWRFETMKDPSAFASCYHSVANDMAEATLKRMHRVSEMSDDFREQLWDEI